jgi:hypothetical protein
MSWTDGSRTSVVDSVRFCEGTFSGRSIDVLGNSETLARCGRRLDRLRGATRRDAARAVSRSARPPRDAQWRVRRRRGGNARASATLRRARPPPPTPRRTSRRSRVGSGDGVAPCDAGAARAMASPRSSRPRSPRRARRSSPTPPWLRCRRSRTGVDSSPARIASRPRATTRPATSRSPQAACRAATWSPPRLNPSGAARTSSPAASLRSRASRRAARTRARARRRAVALEAGAWRCFAATRAATRRAGGTP